MEATVVVEKTNTPDMTPMKTMFLKICDKMGEKMGLSPETLAMIKKDLGTEKDDSEEEDDMAEDKMETDAAETKKEMTPAEMILGLRKTLGA